MSAAGRADGKIAGLGAPDRKKLIAGFGGGQFQSAADDRIAALQASVDHLTELVLSLQRDRRPRPRRQRAKRGSVH